jgi:hypothetical protein
VKLCKLFKNISSISWTNALVFLISIYVVAVALKLPIYPDKVS